MKRFIALSILFVCTISSHNPLCLSLYAQSDYKMAGPYEVVARDGQYRHTKGGSERDMRAAFDFAQKANLLKGSAEGKVCADKAIEIATANKMSDATFEIVALSKLLIMFSSFSDKI